MIIYKNKRAYQPISGRVDRASATETADSGSIRGRSGGIKSYKNRYSQLPA